MSLQSTDFTHCFPFLGVFARIYLGRLIAGWNYLPWQSMVVGKQRVIILLSHKWDLKGLPYLCFLRPLDRWRKRCCPLRGASLFPVPGGVGGLVEGAPQLVGPWRLFLLCHSFSAILFRNAERGGSCSFVGISLKPSWGEEEAALCRLPVVHPHLSAFLCFPTPSCLSLTSWQSYSMAGSFHPISGHAAAAQESLCLAGVLYLNAVKSTMAAACVCDWACGHLGGNLCGQHPQSCREALGAQEGCWNVNCMETLWLSVPWKCFCRAASVCWYHRDIYEMEKASLTSDQWYRGQRELCWQLHRPVAEGIAVLREILSSRIKVFPFTAQPLGRAVPCSQAVSVLLWPSILYQKPLRRAVLGRPLALPEALFWVSMLMLCCKCILFKGCTNYKLVLGDEDKNIFSQPVSVNNLWCYLEMWYSFRVAGNVCAVCEGLQQPQCRASLWSGWQIKQGRNFFAC